MGYKRGAPKKCILCDGISIARSLCKKHYSEHWKAGSLKDFDTVHPVEAFENRIEKTDSCWVWKGTKNDYGYGIFQLPGNKKVRAHRYAYQLYKGPLSEDDLVLHSCDNPICVNPDHLRKGTHADNAKDKVDRQRTKHGEKHWRCELTSAQVELIKNAEGTHRAIAMRFGVNQSTVSRIKAGKRRRLG